MSRRIVPGSPTPPTSAKDENGAFMRAPQSPPPLAVEPSVSSDSIDGMMAKGLNAINKLLTLIHSDINASPGVPDRNTVQSLKDVMGMLTALKEAEDALLEELTEEQLRKLAE